MEHLAEVGIAEVRQRLRKEAQRRLFLPGRSRASGATCGESPGGGSGNQKFPTAPFRHVFSPPSRNRPAARRVPIFTWTDATRTLEWITTLCCWLSGLAKPETVQNSSARRCFRLIHLEATRPPIQRMAKRRSRSEAELKYAFRVRLVDMIGATVQTSIPWVCAVAIAGFTYLSIDSLAGRYTLADIGVAVLADIKISELLAYIFGGGSVLYGLKNRRLKADNVERMAGRIADLEKERDPGRSSSRLTPRGDTRPGDPR